jgi:hypothetical protein
MMRKISTKNADFDPKPVIILDNVQFAYSKEDKLTDPEIHADFNAFIGALYNAAHNRGVVVFLGVSNRYLAAKLAILNGTTCNRIHVGIFMLIFPLPHPIQSTKKVAAVSLAPWKVRPVNYRNARK